MQSFIVLVVALRPNDMLEHSLADTVAPHKITAIINPEKDSSLITPSHKRHRVAKHKPLRVMWPSIKEKLSTALKMCGIKCLS